MKAIKLNVLLALTDQLRVKYKNMIADYTKFFSKSQGDFKGSKRTYTPRDGVIDDPSKRGFINIVTTVDEKIDYFIQESKGFIDALFSQEKTNASNIAKAHLVVNGENWGEYTSLELLRLKSILEASDLGNIENLLINIPVRSDNEIWKETADSDYESRSVFETEKISGVSKTTIKEEYILVDPNLKNVKADNYTPVKSMKDHVHELGDYTIQKFSGEWSHRQRSLALKRRGELLTAITIALKEANEVDSVESALTAKKVFEYIFYGK
jgi:hypothetical protein